MPNKMTEALLGGWWDATASGIKFTGTKGDGKPFTYTYKEEEIQQMAEGYDPEVLEAPVKMEHTEEGQAHGWVKEIRAKRKNGRVYLQVKLKELSETLRKALLEGGYRSRSVEVYINFKNTGKAYLAGLAFLGAGTPAMINLSPFPTLARSLCDGIVRCSGSGGPETLTFEPIPEDFNLEAQEVSEMDAKDIKQAITEGFTSVLTKLKGKEAEDETAVKLKAAEDAKVEAEGKVEAAEKAKTEAEDKLKAKEAEAQLADFKTGVEKARDESRITPADAGMLLKLGEGASEEQRKSILEDVSAREPNKLLSELSQKKGDKIKATNRTAQDRKNAEKVWASQEPEDVDPEDKKLTLAAYDLMDLQGNEKLTFTEAMNQVAAAD